MNDRPLSSRTGATCGLCPPAFPCRCWECHGSLFLVRYNGHWESAAKLWEKDIDFTGCEVAPCPRGCKGAV